MKVLHFADLHLGVENYGHFDSATGLSTRLLDFLAALDRVVDYALGNSIDLVLFCGDAYKTREPTQTQQREFARRISRLSAGGVPVFLLIGNHDLPNGIGRATATEIFDTLAVKNVYVAARPDVYKIPTRSGIAQVAALPWLRRTALLSREACKGMGLEQIKREMEHVLTDTVAALASRADPALPCVLAAHLWVTGARVGSERSMSIGHEPALLPGALANQVFDCVALGHIHRHQVVSASPPVIYSGSLERVDFSEEKEDKGFCVFDIQSGAAGKRQVAFEFIPVPGRPFLTISVELKADDLSPTATVLNEIGGQRDAIPGAVVRLNITLPSGMERLLSDAEIKAALKEAHYFTVTRDVKREARYRLPGWASGGVTPLKALQAYLETSKVPPERAKLLLEFGERLIDERTGPET